MILVLYKFYAVIVLKTLEFLTVVNCEQVDETKVIEPVHQSDSLSATPLSARTNQLNVSCFGGHHDSTAVLFLSLTLTQFLILLASFTISMYMR